MTSEGQHAGQQAEATSGGGGTEPTTKGSAYGTPRAAGEFPSDPDDQPPSGRAAAPQTGWGPDAYPNSYGPPPYPPTGAGSPFVVPAVPVFGTPNGEAQVPGATGGRPDAQTFRSSAQVPAPATEGAESIWGTPPGTDQGHPYHREADGHPYRATAAAGGSAPVPTDDRAQQHGSAPAADGRPLAGGPLPSRADRPPFGGPDGPGNPDAMSGFNGFVSSSAPDRSSAGRQPAGADPDADNRPPGISAFGGQRVRVPGAALNGLGDTPPPVQVGRPTDSAGFHLRGRPERPPVDDEQSGFALRGRPERPDVDGQDEQPGFAALPQPRTPAEPPEMPGPAVGTARPVTASASVPVASRVTPPAEREELPAPGGSGPQPRVYGRSTSAEEQGSADPSDFAAPVSPFPSQSGSEGHPYQSGSEGHPYRSGSDGHPYQDPAGRSFSDPTGDNRPGAPVGRATASARVAPPNGSPFAPPPYPPPAVPASFHPGEGASFAPAPPFAPGNPASFNPGSDPQLGKPYSEHTTDVSGRGRAAAVAPVDRPGGPASGAAAVPFPAAAGPYAEHTTDVAERNGSSAPGTGPAPGPAQEGNRPQPDGAFPGRASVTPPGPAETSSWPAQGANPNWPAQGETANWPAQGDMNRPAQGEAANWPAQGETANWSAPGSNAEQSRFEAFKPEEPAAPSPAADKPETPNVRMLPVLLGVILAAALLVGMAIGVVWLIARPSDSGFDVNAGECVKRNGDKAVTATCGDPGSYTVVSKVDNKEQCGDPEQPYVVNPAGDGRNQVLCLKPSS